jgi:hypothetical protein
MDDPGELLREQKKRDGILRDGIARLRTEGKMTLPMILESAGLPKKMSPDLSNFLKGGKSLSEEKKNKLLVLVKKEVPNLPGNSYYTNTMRFFGVTPQKIQIVFAQIVGNYAAYSIPTSYNNFRVGEIIMRSSIEFSAGDGSIIEVTENQRHVKSGVVEATQTWKGCVIPRKDTFVMLMKESEYAHPRFIFLSNIERMHEKYCSELHGFSCTVTAAGPMFSKIVLKRSVDGKPIEPNMIFGYDCDKEILKALLIEIE